MTNSVRLCDTWFVYLVRTENNKLYCGMSKQPLQRFYQHCTGKGAKFFNSSKAVALVYLAACTDKSEALRQERTIKQLTKRQKEALIIEPPSWQLPIYYSEQLKTMALADIEN